MTSSDLTSKVRKMKPVKGQSLAGWLTRFLTATPDQLSSWKGTFTEVTTAKVVEILRRRGCLEEHTVDQTRFGSLMNAIYRASSSSPASDSNNESSSFRRAQRGGRRNAIIIVEDDVEAEDDIEVEEDN